MLKDENKVTVKDIESELLRRQAQLLKAAQRENVLREIMLSTVSDFEVKEVINSIITEAGQLFEADRCFFVEYDSDNQSIIQVKDSAEYVSSKDIIPQAARYVQKGEVEGFIQVNKLKKVAFVEDTEKADLPAAAKKMLVDDLSVKSYLIVPVFYGETAYGAIIFHYVKKYMHFLDEDIDVAQAIANQSAIVIHQARMYKAMQEQANREKFLRELVSEISGSLDFNEIRKIIVSKSASALNSDLTVLYALDQATEKFFPADEYSLYLSSDEIKNPIGLNLAEKYDFTKYILENKTRDVVYSDIEDLKRDYNLYGTKAEEFLNLYKIKSMIAIPILHANMFLGFLVMNFIKERRRITNEDINLVKVVANQAGITLYQSKLYFQAQEASKAKSEFIATMSHELKTPLNIIMGFSELLSKSNIDSQKQIKYLNNINSSGKHLLNLTNDIISISKIESGNYELNYENINLKDFIIETVNSLNLMFEQEKIIIEMELLEVNIVSDKKILTQILYNLLSNAIKFTPEAGKIMIKIEETETNLIVSIEDTGIGIDSDNLDIIFEKFKQIDSSYERKQQGAGLGLSITKSLVELLDGTIHVASKKDKGSRFWFVLPKD